MSSRRRVDPEAAAQTAAVERVERLEEAVSGIRGGRRLDFDRVVLATGGMLVVLGLVAIFLAWSAAAHTAYLFEQIPYLISGGLLGLACVFLGGFLYFAYWITRMVRESREQARRTAELLDKIAHGLNGSGANGTAPRRPIAGGSGEFVATGGGTLFHRPDCQVVAGKQRLRRVDARAKGMRPCQICDPLGGPGE